jgi:hypothetical protein
LLATGQSPQGELNQVIAVKNGVAINLVKANNWSGAKLRGINEVV